MMKISIFLNQRISIFICYTMFFLYRFTYILAKLFIHEYILVHTTYTNWWKSLEYIWIFWQNFQTFKTKWQLKGCLGLQYVTVLAHKGYRYHFSQSGPKCPKLAQNALKAENGPTWNLGANLTEWGQNCSDGL